MSQILSLKEKYANYFKIGAAVNAKSIQAHGGLIKEQFNSLTAENATKPSEANPREGVYCLEEADTIAAFAKENGLALRGHTFVWHNQVPDWWFEGANAEQLMARVEQYMKTMAGRYPQMYCWDVVNEAVEDKEDYLLRKSPWLEICGEDFIPKAFELARSIMPNTDLYYNDYSEFRPDKCEKMVKLLTWLKERGAPVDGVGLQCHWQKDYPTYDELCRGMEAFAKLGLKIHITEMDLSVCAQDELSAKEKTAEDMELQAKRYGEAFRVFREYHELVDCVTLWGVSDDMTWLDYFPAKRKNWPLLFDENGQPKEAFYRITDF